MHSTDQSPGPGHRVKQHSSTLRVGRQLQKSEHCTGVTGQRVKMHARCTLCNVHILLTVILLLELAQKKSSGKNKMCKHEITLSGLLHSAWEWGKSLPNAE